MFKQKYSQRSIGVFLSVLGLSACDNQSSPRWVLKSAYSAIADSDLPRFQSYLEAEALENFGSLRRMQQLKQILGAQKPSMSKATHLYSEAISDREKMDYYNVAIESKSGSQFNSKLRCHSVLSETEHCTPDHDFDRPDRPFDLTDFTPSPLFENCHTIEYWAQTCVIQTFRQLK